MGTAVDAGSGRVEVDQQAGGVVGVTHLSRDDEGLPGGVVLGVHHPVRPGNVAHATVGGGSDAVDGICGLGWPAAHGGVEA